MTDLDLLGIFGEAILPIIAIAAAGFVLGRTKSIDPGPLNTAVVYVLAPALVFHSLAVTQLAGGTLLRIAAGVLLFTVIMVAIGEAIGRLTGETEPVISALILVIAFTNSGNYGIPVSDFAFGPVGRQTAVVFLTAQAVLVYTVGVYIASRSGGGSGLEGIKRVLKIPLVYAVIVALLLRAGGLVPPADAAAMEAVQLVGDSSIPVMLLILGIQLANTDYGSALSRATKPTLLKMGLAPIVGVGIAVVLGFEDPTVARVFVLETAMPAAVTPLVLIVEFAGDETIGELTVAEYVSTVILVTTLVSVPLLTVLIALLQSGVIV
ncbi:AEC family transporter [Natronocalculus amylovorans]|uniref:AEC family transporter n=1 Tax=Natronocalculus amylovorans TaxID=2917812 RepID=A0AAE3K6R9_9EURY|nr:AEC family transporter [Natronocalculus amylovorans]MCL9815502.1 AEC family transporter [Natronocalculus amylovorans]